MGGLENRLTTTILQTKALYIYIAYLLMITYFAIVPIVPMLPSLYRWVAYVR